jgi:SPP1 family predicted phage head-tail adaptor
MRIGDLRHRITFQREVKTADGSKGFTVAWRDLISVWASVEPLSGREFFAAHQMKAEITHRVKIRYRTDITVKMRIKHRDRVLEIESIIDKKERREELEIFCREKK